MSTVGVTRQPRSVTSQSAAERIRRVHRAAAGLRADTSLLDIVTAAPEVVCEALGFDRALLCHVREDHIAAASTANPRDPDRATEFAKLTRTARAKLVDAPPELEAVTTQLPVLVRGADKPGAAVLRSATMLLGTVDYVVAPIVHTGRVIGLLFADRDDGGEPLTDLDRELLFIFATGLGWSMRDAAVAHMYDGESRLAPSPGAFVETQLAHLVHTLADVPGGWARESVDPIDDAVLGQLTPREYEVLVLLASGASNQAIATALVVSEATVKSHVRGVLRKLNAKNRTEAVARYHSLTARGLR